jgi:hypothetical protein
MAKRDHLFNFHSEKRTKSITGKVGKQVPVIREVRQYKTSGEKPDPCFGNTDTGREVGMPLGNVNSPDRFKTCLSDPGNQDEEGDCYRDPGDSSADNLPLPTRIIVAATLNTLRKNASSCRVWRAAAPDLSSNGGYYPGEAGYSYYDVRMPMLWGLLQYHGGDHQHQ